MGAESYVGQIVAAFAVWCVGMAQSAIVTLLGAFGQATEPDFTSIAPVYDQMLAISLLLVGCVIAVGLVEQILGGPQGLGWSVIPRTLLAVSFAFCGLEVVEYLARYAALLATTWSPDLLGVNAQLSHFADSYTHIDAKGHYPMGSLGGLILTALLTSFLALLVYLEVVVRAALILVMTAFIPLVCALSIWPRMAGAGTALGEFLVGLLPSKFVVATAVYIGYGLVLPSVLGSQHGDWMLTGLAVLFIAAFSPLVLVQGLRFTHTAAAGVARSWVATGVGFVPFAPAVQLAHRLAAPRIANAWRSLKTSRNTSAAS